MNFPEGLTAQETAQHGCGIQDVAKKQQVIVCGHSNASCVLMGVGGRGYYWKLSKVAKDKSLLTVFPAFSFSHCPIKEILALATPLPCLSHSLMKTLVANWFICTSVAQNQGGKPRDRLSVLF